MLLDVFAGDADDPPSFLPQWLAIALAGVSGLCLLVNGVRRLLMRRRRSVLDDVIRHSTSREALKGWFSVPLDEGRWWHVWRSSRRAAIQWLHGRVAAARTRQLPAAEAFEVSW
ncbi:hypothetical protein [Nonomuraea aridisoli]|uniref:Uncharacterized protein n=1 Tax=Nonomuraea aridisoli TaxID=2070368 RepID=A0A2W2ESA2_9ACTN|nr:hypothetical protein [Nonomuraea aridisoli]PZG16400.1 hypothetical protein C1J01_21100 [Nonomuraea aridisoli]